MPVISTCASLTSRRQRATRHGKRRPESCSARQEEPKGKKKQTRFPLKRPTPFTGQRRRESGDDSATSSQQSGHQLAGIVTVTRGQNTRALVLPDNSTLSIQLARFFQSYIFLVFFYQVLTLEISARGRSARFAIDVRTMNRARLFQYHHAFNVRARPLPVLLVFSFRAPRLAMSVTSVTTRHSSSIAY